MSEIIQNENKKSLINPHQLDELRLGPKARLIVEYLFDNPSLTQRQIAKDLGIAEQRVSTVLRHPKVLDAFPVLAKRKLKSIVPKAMKRFGELLEQKDNPEVARKVTMSALESQKILSNVTEININHRFEAMDTTKLVEFISESKKTTGDVVDAEIVSEVDNQA